MVSLLKNMLCLVSFLVENCNTWLHECVFLHSCITHCFKSILPIFSLPGGRYKGQRTTTNISRSFWYNKSTCPRRLHSTVPRTRAEHILQVSELFLKRSFHFVIYPALKSVARKNLSVSPVILLQWHRCLVINRRHGRKRGFWWSSVFPAL